MKIQYHNCEELKKEIHGLKYLDALHAITIWHHDVQKFWIMSLYQHADIIINYCPFCGVKLK